MGHQIIKQPDGKLCVWSTVVDDFIVTDAEPDQLVQMYAVEAAEEAAARTRKIIAKVERGAAREAYFQFAMTYAEAVELRDEVHSHAAAAGRAE